MRQVGTASWSGNPIWPDWSAVYKSQRCEVCGRTRMPAAMDWIGQWNEMVYAPMMESWNRVWGDLYPAWTPSWAPKSHAVDRGCPRCKPDDCHCRCCVVNADLVIYARVGERRVAPLIIENNVRREREVELELSGWTNQGEQSVQVQGQLEPPLKFTLKPCEEREAILIVNVIGATIPGTANEQRQGDVDVCKVFYADLRVKGCDIRPIRIAVAALPRDCEATRIDCRCGCC
jgi:hypothetical protein